MLGAVVASCLSVCVGAQVCVSRVSARSGLRCVCEGTCGPVVVSGGEGPSTYSNVRCVSRRGCWGLQPSQGWGTDIGAHMRLRCVCGGVSGPVVSSEAFVYKHCQDLEYVGGMLGPTTDSCVRGQWAQ